MPIKKKILQYEEVIEVILYRCYEVVIACYSYAVM